MENEFLFEKEFRKWYRKNHKYKKPVTEKEKEEYECVREIRNILNDVDEIPCFEKKFLTYVPALMARNKDMAIRLLSYVYADGYIAGNKCSHFQHYINFCIKKKTWDGTLTLDSNEYEEIREYLDKRIIWICNENFSDYHYVDKKNGDVYVNNFRRLFDARIRRWDRPGFPLNIIKSLLNRDFNREWVNNTYKKIDVLTSNATIKLKDIAIFDFRKLDNKYYEVFIIQRSNKKIDRVPMQIYTPCADSGYKWEKRKVMLVGDPREVSIDHVVPLDKIIKQIKTDLPDLGRELEKAIELKHDGYNENSIKPSAESLKRIMNKILESTKCVLMEQSENSKKSNNTIFQRYEYYKTSNTFVFIVADDVLNPVDNEFYTIFYTLNNNIYSDIKMAKKGEKLI